MGVFLQDISSAHFDSLRPSSDCIYFSDNIWSLTYVRRKKYSTL